MCRAVRTKGSKEIENFLLGFHRDAAQHLWLEDQPYTERLA
ncbi:hypothetical protein SAMN04488061_1093 [Filomicrobium insigne]|uniref:Uncharacterized protein n=1 Tax=Filomicrobium insigne TaxID=418854 RepID=A0A1H0J9T1_9HYPH|nr:hypothetical protein SAMN04488061_1093 [Filomicrobium insigne]